MKNGLDFKIGSSSVGSLLSEPLTKNKDNYLIVDLGARGGFFSYPHSLAALTTLVGFEPNPVEHEKLVSQKTDAILSGMSQPRFLETKYFPKAVWSSDSQKILFVTKGPGATSLMGVADSQITKKMNFCRNAQGPFKNYFGTHLEIDREVNVECMTLDSIFKELPPRDFIDFLKVDVEGAELDVFQGAEQILNDHKVLMIKSEFVAFPYYEPKHPVLGEQHAFLNKKGYRLLDFDFNQSRYLRTQSSPFHPAIDRRPVYAGDAYYIIDPDKNNLSPQARLRLGVMLISQDFLSLGFELVKESGLIPEDKVDLCIYRISKGSFAKKMVYAWKNIPAIVRSMMS